MSPDWRRIRAEFPVLEAWTFLNTATYGQMPRRGVEAVASHFARRDALACADFLEWYDDADRIRASIGRLVNCAPAGIAFIPNASAALSLFLGGIEWRKGDRVVTLEHDFPNQYYFPGHLRHRGVEFVETPRASFREAIHERTRAVVLSSVSYSTGARAPLEEIAPFLRERGVPLYIDGTQSVGALRFDVGALRPEMLAVHGYKWLLAPNGAGFMYVSPELRERLEPNVIGWRSHKDWRNPDNLHHGTPEFKTEAERYEGGGLVFPSIYAMGASVDMLLEIGPEAVEGRVLDLAAQTRAVLRRAGGEVSEGDSQIVTANFEGRDAAAMAAALRTHRVLVAARRGNLRVSPHLYNNEEDLERLEQALRDVSGS